MSEVRLVVSAPHDVHIRHALDDPNNRSLGDDRLHVQFVRNLGTSVATLQSKVAILSTIQVSIDNTLRELQSCSFTLETFQTHLEALQRAIDQLNLEQYSNIPFWVTKMNEKIIAILRGRLQQAIKDLDEDFEHGQGTVDQSQRQEDAPTVPCKTENPAMFLTGAQIP